MPELADSDVANKDIKFFGVKHSDIGDIHEFSTSLHLERRLVGPDVG